MVAIPMTPREKAVKETKDELSWLENQIEQRNRQWDNWASAGQFWRLKQLKSELRGFEARKQELQQFLDYLDFSYQDEMDALEYQPDSREVRQCSCGLFVSGKDICMACGRPCCTLHSVAESYTSRRKHVSRICDTCRDQ